MPTIELQEVYADWVNDNVVSMFADRGIEITPNAHILIAFTMQSQVEEDVMNRDRLFRRAEGIVGPKLFDYYLKRYGEGRVTFNRAFHLLNDLGFVVKFPWVPTRPPGTP